MNFDSVCWCCVGCGCKVLCSMLFSYLGRLGWCVCSGMYCSLCRLCLLCICVICRL